LRHVDVGRQNWISVRYTGNIPLKRYYTAMTTLPTSLSTVAPGHYLQFASDSASGICPEAMQAFMAANTGFGGVLRQ